MNKKQKKMLTRILITAVMLFYQIGELFQSYAVGKSRRNISALTGESLPIDAKVGDEIISGCINMTGVLKVQTTKEFGESTVSKSLELVENSSSRKSKSENFISRFAKVYTPVVCYGALALAILPPVIRMIFMGAAPQWGTWIYR